MTMNTELLKQLDSALASEELHIDDVLQIVGKYSSPQAAETNEKSSRLLQILSFIGGGIIFLGVAFWIGQEWRHFGSFAKIVSTLGISIGFFVSAVLLGKTEEQSTLSNVFFLLSALLMPLGLGVTYDELDLNLEPYPTATLIALILSGVFFAAYCLFKRNLLLFISIVFVTILFFVCSDWLVQDVPRLAFFDRGEHFTFYRLMAAGLSWICLGHAFMHSDKRSLTSWLYMFGSFTVLLTGLLLGDWKPNQSAFWEIVYPGLALGFVFLSVHLKSRSFLVFGALGFGAYLCKITAEYFSDSLGWPLALILMGMSLIAIAFAAVCIRNKHLKNI